MVNRDDDGQSQDRTGQCSECHQITPRVESRRCRSGTGGRHRYLRRIASACRRAHPQRTKESHVIADRIDGMTTPWPGCIAPASSPRSTLRRSMMKPCVISCARRRGRLEHPSQASLEGVPAAARARHPGPAGWTQSYRRWLTTLVSHWPRSTLRCRNIATRMDETERRVERLNRRAVNVHAAIYAPLAVSAWSLNASTQPA